MEKWQVHVISDGKDMVAWKSVLNMARTGAGIVVGGGIFSGVSGDCINILV